MSPIITLLVIATIITSRGSSFLLNQVFIEPYIDICTGDIIPERILQSYCEKDLILGPRPENDCICLQGLWLSLDSQCSPRFHIGFKGCTKTRKIQALKYIGTFGILRDFVVIVTVSQPQTKKRKHYEAWPDIMLLRPIQRITSAGATWVINGRMIVRGNVYCVERYVSPEGESVSEYHVIGLIVVQSECILPGDPVEPEKYYRLHESIPSSLQCEQDCSKLNVSTAPKIRSTKSPFKLPSKDSLGRVLKTRNNSRSFLGRNSVINADALRKNRGSTLSDRESILLELKVLNTVMLRRSVTLALSNRNVFKVTNNITPNEYAFHILNRLIDITLNLCGKSIPGRFLRRAYKFFQAAYQVKGDDLYVVFSEQEFQDINEALDKCSSSIKSPFNFKSYNSDCNNEVDVYEIYPRVFIPINMTKGHPNFNKHLVLDTVWNTIDLVRAVCIGAFKKSYLLYHRWEQGMEKLFTNTLRILWRFPEASEKFYMRLLGPNWKVWGTNVEKCVEAVYIKNYKMKRLQRPLWIPGYHNGTYKFAFWRNHTLTYSMDGTPNEENLRSKFPMTSKSKIIPKVSPTASPSEAILPSEDTQLYVCGRNYNCQPGK